MLMPTISFCEGWNINFASLIEGNAQARQMFEKVIALDTSYARAYATLSLTYWLDWIWQWSQDPQALGHALMMGQKAAALDDSLPYAHIILSQVFLWKKEYEQAIAEGERAITVD